MGGAASQLQDSQNGSTNYNALYCIPFQKGQRREGTMKIGLLLCKLLDQSACSQRVETEVTERKDASVSS